MCRYAAAYPDEDGYRRVETLNEDVLGSDLWTAARVSRFWRTFTFLAVHDTEGIHITMVVEVIANRSTPLLI